MTESSSACPCHLTQDLLSLNCLLIPELPSAPLKLWGLHSWWCLQENSDYFGWEEEPSLEACKVAGPWDARSHQKSLQNVENGISHVLNLNLKAALLEPSMSSTSLLAFVLSLLPAWAAHEELSFCHSLHPSVIPFPRPLCYRLSPGPPASKGPVRVTLCNRCLRLDRWTICSINSNPPNSILDSATTSSNGNVLIPDFSVLL